MWPEVGFSPSTEGFPAFTVTFPVILSHIYTFMNTAKVRAVSKFFS